MSSACIVTLGVLREKGFPVAGDRRKGAEEMFLAPVADGFSSYGDHFHWFP